jgi:hypothetical protein
MTENTSNNAVGGDGAAAKADRVIRLAADRLKSDPYWMSLGQSYEVRMREMFRQWRREGKGRGKPEFRWNRAPRHFAVIEELTAENFPESDAVTVIANVVIPFMSMPPAVREAAVRYGLPPRVWTKVAKMVLGDEARVPGGRLIWDADGLKVVERRASTRVGDQGDGAKNRAMKEVVAGVRVLSAHVDEVAPDERADLANLLRGFIRALEDETPEATA